MPSGGAGGASTNDNGDDGGDAIIQGPDGFLLTAKGGGGGSGWGKSPNPGGCGGGAAGPGPDNGGSLFKQRPHRILVLVAAVLQDLLVVLGTPYMVVEVAAGVGADGGGQPGNGGAGFTFPNYTGNLIGIPLIHIVVNMVVVEERCQDSKGRDGGAPAGGGTGAYRYPQSMVLLH